MNKLETARNEINAIDKEMATLFERRMNAAKLVAEYKKENGLPIFDSEREKVVIEKNSAYINDAVLKDYYIEFIKNTMDISKCYQKRLLDGMRVAYSGVPGAFAHIAASKIFDNTNPVSYQSFKEAYEAVEKGECDFGIAMCGSGNGIQMTLNKHQQIRAALCWQPEIAALAKQHNNANVLVLPARFIDEKYALEIVKAYLDAEFEGGRHQKRVEKIPVK